jgi:hypothetical protein
MILYRACSLQQLTSRSNVYSKLTVHLEAIATVVGGEDASLLQYSSALGWTLIWRK